MSQEKWEYLVKDKDILLGKDFRSFKSESEIDRFITEKLNELGEQGWELVLLKGLGDKYIFKRQL
jgi:hypothetical protein